MATQSATTTSPNFTSYYLQQATKEFAEDLDKIRNADDFRAGALPMLIKALQQGSALFSPEEQTRILGTGGRGEAADIADHGDDEGVEALAVDVEMENVGQGREADESSGTSEEDSGSEEEDGGE